LYTHTVKHDNVFFVLLATSFGHHQTNDIHKFKNSWLHIQWSRDSSVGIATRYGLEGPGIESRWGEIFRTCPDRLRSPPSLLYNGYRGFPGGESGRVVMLTTHSLLVPRLRKSRAIPPLTLWVLLGLLRGSLLLPFTYKVGSRFTTGFRSRIFSCKSNCRKTSTI
jgi:hypothetical protein